MLSASHAPKEKQATSKICPSAVFRALYRPLPQSLCRISSREVLAVMSYSNVNGG